MQAYLGSNPTWAAFLICITFDFYSIILKHPVICLFPPPRCFNVFGSFVHARFGGKPYPPRSYDWGMGATILKPTRSFVYCFVNVWRKNRNWLRMVSSLL